MTKYKCVVIGGSAGSITTIAELLRPLSACVDVAILAVVHRSRTEQGALCEIIAGRTGVDVIEGANNIRPKPGCVYLAPSNRHMTLSRSGTIELSQGPPVNGSRPSIDVLFESMAATVATQTLGIILSGSNDDGIYGARVLKQNGGALMVHKPGENGFCYLPRRVLAAVEADWVLDNEQLAKKHKMSKEPPGLVPDGALIKASQSTYGSSESVKRQSVQQYACRFVRPLHSTWR
jgi:two-component system chemotaxis response regulator CheB